MTEINHALQSCGPLKELGPDLLEELEKHSTLFKGLEGSYLIRQSEKPDAAYILVTGRAQVVVTREDRTTYVAARLGPGSLIGEASFLRPDGRRNSDVILTTDATLIRICGESIRFVLERSSGLLSALKTKDLRDSISREVAESILSKCLSESEMIEIISSRRKYDKGDVVFREGELSEDLFLIISGSVDVSRREDNDEILIAHIGRGNIFGEIDVINQSHRSATVVAAESLEVFVIDGLKFRDEMAQSDYLRNLITSQEGMYHLPGSGFVFQGYSEIEGHSAIRSIYELADGRRISAVRLLEVEKVAFRQQSTNEQDVLEWIQTSAQADVRVAICKEKIFAIESSIHWEGLEDAVALLLSGKTIDPWRQALFYKAGMLTPPARNINRLPTDLICTCACVQYQAVLNLVSNGLEFKAIQNQTGVGTVCGSCIPRLKDLYGKDSMIPVKIVESEDLTKDIRRFRIVGFNDALPKSEAGQYIVLEGLVDNEWVQRSYTLVGIDGGISGWEIAVKRDPHGLFSNWLFNEGRSAIIRVSEPQGKALPADKKIICFVGGIGVTPAIAISRLGRRNKVSIVYSVKSFVDAAYIHELKQLASEGRIDLTIHETSTNGRISDNDIQSHFESDSKYLICGPISYEEKVVSILEKAGIDRDSIIVESFSATGKYSSHHSVEHRPVMPALCPAHQHVDVATVDSPLLPHQEAESLIRQFYSEMEIPAGLQERILNIKPNKPFNPEREELEFAARVAWRNANRCIGRLYWPGLFFRDLRHINNPEGMLEEMAIHTRLATNGGRLRSMMTIFAPLEELPPRILSPQLVRYAGYEQSEGSIQGDPAHIDLTKLAIENGWIGAGGRFDVLPLMIKDNTGNIHIRPHDPNDVLEVNLEHPHYEWFSELELKWHALPAVTQLCLDAFGRMYPVVFSGVYMGTEIGSRNLCDPYRYNILPEVAHRMGLDTRSEASLWRDKALVEVNVAVIHSYRRAGVTILDHHTASSDFMKFVEKEHSTGRQVHAEWSWIVPPLSGSSVPQFHLKFPNNYLKPALVARPHDK